jgi:hypothetical protein
MFHTSHKVWVYLHGNRHTVDDNRWDIDVEEVNHMKGVIAKIVETHRLNSDINF